MYANRRNFSVLMHFMSSHCVAVFVDVKVYSLLSLMIYAGIYIQCFVV